MNMKSSTSILLAGLLATVSCAGSASSQTIVPPPVPIGAGDVNLSTFLELARSDLKARKTFLIAQNLPLTEAEATVFWPLRNQYEAEFDLMVERKLELIKRHTRQLENPTDREASELVRDGLDLEHKQTDLKQKYFKRFAAALPATKVALFFQIENQLNLELALKVEQALQPVSSAAPAKAL